MDDWLARVEHEMFDDWVYVVTEQLLVGHTMYTASICDETQCG